LARRFQNKSFTISRQTGHGQGQKRRKRPSEENPGQITRFLEYNLG